MTTLQRKLLLDVIAATAEPLVVARVDQGDWPLVLVNPALGALASRELPAVGAALADVIERLHGRDVAREISQAVRAGHETRIPLEAAGRRWLLHLRPLGGGSSQAARYCAVFWHSGDSAVARAATHHALKRARQRLRDLARDDPLTGLMTGAAFRDVLQHDWAVAAREQASLALMAFTIDDFGAYVQVFGRYAADTCLRRVAQAVRRRLRRASDVAARLVDGGNERFVVLFRATDDVLVGEFAARIARDVRNLGLHHPRSKVARFVTVSTKTSVVTAHGGPAAAERFLNDVLGD